MVPNLGNNIVDAPPERAQTEASKNDGDDSSAIAGLAKLLAISRPCHWRELPMAVLGVAFDASIDRDNRWLSVGGFISSAADWDDFDVAWRKRLAEDGLTYFHMVDFAHSVQEFTGWKDQEARRRGLLADLIGIIESHVYRKIGFMVEVKEYDKLSSAKEVFGTTAFAATAFVAICGAYTWCLAEFKAAPYVFFEEGDTDASSLNNILEKNGTPKPIYQPKKDDPKTGRLGFTPLHAADMFAYEMTKVPRAAIGPDNEVRLRHPFQRFNVMPGHSIYLDADRMPSLEALSTQFRKDNLK